MMGARGKAAGVPLDSSAQCRLTWINTDPLVLVRAAAWLLGISRSNSPPIMRLSSTRKCLRKRSWLLIVSWSVFWAITALVTPFCEGWAAIEVAGNHATHQAAPVPAADNADPTQDGTQCCHMFSEAPVLVPSPETSKNANVFGPITSGTSTALAIPDSRATFFRLAPAPPPRLPVFLNTRRLRI